ncbi:ROK family protein [Streptomyces sp. NPDC085479]|uniref:ROK family protein n=1 Tax=Streptomyces sp. NPDC085479 TaxID=3365726 RepID=UPI0037D5F732
MKPRAGSKALIREINEALVLDVVRAHGPVARAAITTRTGLSAATVTGIAARLLSAGMLTETDVVRGTGGRPARLLELGSSAVLAAGVRLSSSEVYVTLVNLRGDVVSSHREGLSSTDPATCADAVARAVRTATGRTRSPSLIGVGVAVSGVVDHANGVVRHSGAMGWEDVPFRARLAALLDCPVSLDSYVNCVASGLLLFDGGLAGRDLLVFSVGMSLGASVVVQGRIHRGFEGAAGGFAHSHITGAAAGPDAGRPCHCGAVDCLETWSSYWGIQRERERRGTADRPLPDADGDPLTGTDGELFAEAAERLGSAMANAAKLLGPERVFVAFAGEMGHAVLASGTEREFLRQFAHGNTPVPAFEQTRADETALARGAAYTILARVFTTDILEEHADETGPKPASR